MTRCIGKVQHATIELFRCLCTYGYGITHGSIVANSGSVGKEKHDTSSTNAGYRSFGDVVYIIDKMAKKWPTYVPCSILERVERNASSGHNSGADVVQYVVRPLYLNDESGTYSSTKNSIERKKSKPMQQRRRKNLQNDNNNNNNTSSSSSSSSDDEDDENGENGNDDGEYDSSDDAMQRGASAMFEGASTLMVEEINILSGRQFSLEIGFHISVITIFSEQIRSMKLDNERINDTPHKECKLISSCLACLTACMTLKTMLRDILNPKNEVLKHLEWIMSVAVQGGSNMSPIMLTKIWLFCHSILTSPHLRTQPHPDDGANGFIYEEKEDPTYDREGKKQNASSFSAVFVVRELKLSDLEEQIGKRHRSRQRVKECVFHIENC